MRAYAGSIFGSETLAEQTRYLTRQYGLLEDAVMGGKAVALFDSLSLSQSSTMRTTDIAFAQIEDHVCELGFVHYEDADDPGKRAYVQAFQRVFRSAADRNGWEVS